MRKSTLALLAALWTAASAAQTPQVADWFAVPSDQSAISIYFEPQQQSSLLLVEDASGEVIDKIEWYGGFPLVRQYRVEPGAYSLRFAGLPGEFSAKAAPGKMTSFVVRDDIISGLEVALKAEPFSPQDAKFAGALETISGKLGSAYVEPVAITPAKNELVFRFAPPGVRPPPE